MMFTKEIQKDQLNFYFGKLQELLRLCRKKEEGYYLTCVSIKDLPKTNQIEVEFSVEYGPIGVRTSDGIFTEVESCQLKMIYNKDGSFAGYEGEEPKYNSNNIYPSYFTLPSFEDFPEPEEDGLFDILSDIIKKCNKCGMPLSTILFYTQSPVLYGEYTSGSPAYEDDGGEAPFFDGTFSGFCLKQDLLDEYNYSFSLVKDTNIKNEYRLIFRVNTI